MAAAELAQVPGRFERVDLGQPFTVIVDYAHTDDALRNLTAVAREFLAAARRVGTSHHRVRMRRRPRPQQTSADGRGRRSGQRLGGADQRQSPQRESARHHERRAAGPAALGRSLHLGTGSRAKPSPWPFTRRKPVISCSSPARATRRSRSRPQAPFRSTTSKWRDMRCATTVTHLPQPTQSATS